MNWMLIALLTVCAASVCSTTSVSFADRIRFALRICKEEQNLTEFDSIVCGVLIGDFTDELSLGVYYYVTADITLGYNMLNSVPLCAQEADNYYVGVVLLLYLHVFALLASGW